MDCEKLVQEKTEMQRHYVMVSNHRQTQFPTLEIELSINEKGGGSIISKYLCSKVSS